MSIIVGKRNFIENFNNMMISDFPQESRLRSKMILTENSSHSRNIDHYHDHKNLVQNFAALQRRFSQTPDQELAAILEDCDNNLEVAIEILTKATQSAQSKQAPPNLKPKPGRVIKSLCPVEKPKQKPSPAQEEEKKADNSIQEEEPNQAMQKQEFQYLAENLVLKLQTMNDRDEIRDLIAQVFYEVKNNAEKKGQEEIKKLEEHKGILIEGFRTQMRKIKVLEETNKDLNTLINNHEQELSKLRHINYMHELRLKKLNAPSNQIANCNIYK